MLNENDWKKKQTFIAVESFVWGVVHVWNAAVEADSTVAFKEELEKDLNRDNLDCF